MGKKGHRTGNGNGSGHSRGNNPHLNQNVSTHVTHSSVESIAIREDQSEVVVRSLNLAAYKTKKCPIKQDHVHKQCPYYHNPMDKKRPGEFYSHEVCEHHNQGNCPHGDECLKAHNNVEQLYREDKYKRKFCYNYPNKLAECEYGDFCSFAHNENEIKIELIHNYVFDADFYIFHYKTVWCPFNLTTHDKGLCVYAHNWQDYRRKPSEYDYLPEPCQHWKAKEYIHEYSQGCPTGVSCDKCHGWKELEFHPLVYKMNVCRQPDKCKQEASCPQYHSDRDRRYLDKRVMQNLMHYYPKNRIIKGTYKRNPDSPPQSISKSLDGNKFNSNPPQNFLPAQFTNTPRTRAVQKQGNDTLLKRSLKRDYPMNMSHDEQHSSHSSGHPKQTYQHSSFKSASGLERPKTMSYNSSGCFDYGAHHSSSYHDEEPDNPPHFPGGQLQQPYQTVQGPSSFDQFNHLDSMNYQIRHSPQLNNYQPQMQHCDSFDGSLGNVEFGDGQEFEDGMEPNREVNLHTPNFPSRFHQLRRNQIPPDHASIASHQDYQQVSRAPIGGKSFAPDMRHVMTNHPMDKRSRSLMLEENKHEKPLTTSKFRQRAPEAEIIPPNVAEQDSGSIDNPRAGAIQNYSQFSRPFMNQRPGSFFPSSEGPGGNLVLRREDETQKAPEPNKSNAVPFQPNPNYPDNRKLAPHPAVINSMMHQILED